METIEKAIPVRTYSHQPASWPKNFSARLRLQRVFDAWYRTNMSRFLVDLEFVRRTDDYLHFAFHGFERSIDATLSADLSVHITWDGVWWDELLTLEAYPIKTEGGYVCSECDPTTRPVFPTRQALWEAELFDPFLAWVNECLAVAQTLHLSRTGGMTSAKLIR
jgi:hypothetical protein